MDADEGDSDAHRRCLADWAAAQAHGVLAGGLPASRPLLSPAGSAHGLPVYVHTFIDGAMLGTERAGEVMMFGRIRGASAGQEDGTWPSCCVRLASVPLVLSFASRAGSTREQVEADAKSLLARQTGGEVWDEIGSQVTWAWRERKYCFAGEDVPRGASDWLEATCPPELPTPPATARGAHFSKMCGSRLPAKLRVLVNRRVRGPSWIVLSDRPGEGRPAALGGLGASAHCDGGHDDDDEGDDEDGAPAAVGGAPRSGVRWVPQSERVSSCDVEVMVGGPGCVFPVADPAPMGSGPDVVAAAEVRLAAALAARGLPPTPPLRAAVLSLRRRRRDDVSRRGLIVGVGCLVVDDVEVDGALRPLRAGRCLGASLDGGESGGTPSIPDGDDGDADERRESLILSALLEALRVSDPDLFVLHGGEDGAVADLVAAMGAHGLAWWRIGRLHADPHVVPGATLNPGASRAYPRLALAGRLVSDTRRSATQPGGLSARSYALEELTAAVTEPVPPPEGAGAAAVASADALLSGCFATLRLLARLDVLRQSKLLTALAGNRWQRSLLGGFSNRVDWLLMHAFAERGYVLPDLFDDDEGDSDDDEEDGGTASAATRPGARLLTSPADKDARPAFAAAAPPAGLAAPAPFAGGLGTIVSETAVAPAPAPAAPPPIAEGHASAPSTPPRGASAGPAASPSLSQGSRAASVSSSSRGRRSDEHKNGSRTHAMRLEGGLVLTPRAGLYREHVALLDFKSLYPSLISEFNLCLSTLDWAVLADDTGRGRKPTAEVKARLRAATLEDEAGRWDPRTPRLDADRYTLIPPIPAYGTRAEGGAAAGSDGAGPPPSAADAGVAERASRLPASSPEAVRGVIPSIMDALMARRADARRRASGADDATRERLESEQRALKVLANSVFGSLGSRWTRFSAVPVAALVTMQGRKVLRLAKRAVEDIVAPRFAAGGAVRVIYGDTDSLMVATGRTSLAEAEEVAAAACDAVSCLFRGGAMLLARECVFARLLLVAKKQYVGLMDLGGGAFRRKQVGVFLVRRDWSDLARATGRLVLDAVVGPADGPPADADGDARLLAEAVVRRAGERVRGGACGWPELTLHKGLRQDPAAYPVETYPQAAVALRMQAAGVRVSAGDAVPFVVVRNPPGSAGAEAADGLTPSPIKLSVRARHVDEVGTGSAGLAPAGAGADGGDGAAPSPLRPDTHWYLQQQLVQPLAALLAPLGTVKGEVPALVGLPAGSGRGRGRGGAGKPECEVCGKSFYDNSTLRRHIKRVHGADPDAPAAQLHRDAAATAAAAAKRAEQAAEAQAQAGKPPAGKPAIVTAVAEAPAPVRAAGGGCCAVM